MVQGSTTIKQRSMYLYRRGVRRSLRRCILFLCAFGFFRLSLVAAEAAITKPLSMKGQRLALDSRPTLPPPQKPRTFLSKGAQDPLSMKTAITKGILLAFNSGFINGCCLSGGIAADGTKQGVAAVTGAYTTSALGLADGNSKQFTSQLSVLASYIAGSMLSGLIEPYPVTFVSSSTHSMCFYIGAVLLFYATVLALQTDASTAPQMSFCLAAAANGMQNSLSSTYTGNLCRTSHFTGMSSDIGTFLGQCLRGNTANHFRLKVFGGLALSFWTGGFTSYFVTRRYTSASLLFSACFYVALGAGVVEATVSRHSVRYQVKVAG